MDSDSLSKVLKGDSPAAAWLMRGIDDELPEAIALLGEIYLNTGHAHIVGMSGAPGAGKSTLLGRLIHLARKSGVTVGVVAVDPTSPFSGGAVLGDRVRMQGAGVDAEVFIRSLASRGCKGGLSWATINTVHVMDAMGKDIIFVEAVGSGQGEVDIARVSDTVIVVLTPGMGDEVQMMKAGILEAADIFAINKADRSGAESLKGALDTMLGMKTRSPGEWRPSVVMTEAVNDRGTEELLAEVIKHRQYLVASGELENRRRERARLELSMAVEISLEEQLARTSRELMEKTVDDLLGRKTNPQRAAREILDVIKDG